VRVAQYQGKNGIPKFLIETLNGAIRADVTFSWFADVHAFGWFCSCQSYLNSDAKSKV